MASSGCSFKTLALLSSCLFLSGMVLALFCWFGVGIDSSNNDDRELAAILNILAWSIVGASIIPEIIIDATTGLSTTIQFHGRHGPRNSAVLSWCQTLSFAVGVITMGMAMKRNWDSSDSTDPFFRDKQYRNSGLFLMSSIFITFAGVLSVVSAGCCCCNGRRNDGGVQIGVASQVLVQTSNIMFLVAPALLLFAVAIDGFCAQCFSGYFLAMFAFCLWIGCGIMWIIADALLPREENGTRPEEQEQQQQNDTEQGDDATKPEVPIAEAVAY